MPVVTLGGKLGLFGFVFSVLRKVFLFVIAFFVVVYVHFWFSQIGFVLHNLVKLIAHIAVLKTPTNR